MIKTIIKRDGTKEDFSADKINGWSEWASKTLGRYVNWSEVVVNTVGTLPTECTSQELQESLIRYCLGKHTWEYNRMAGRLYSSLLTRLIHNSDKYPTVKEVHDKLYKDGLMRKLDYTDEEYAEVEKIIDHSINLKYPHYALHQNRMKYSLCNRVTGKEYETSQIMYMRMAMSASEFEPKDQRMQSVRDYYDAFANHRLNVPTPFYLNLGTKLNGYASCCLLTVKDEVASLATGDHISYMMTAMSAGIGFHIKTRSLHDPVRGGAISHYGKLPYLRSHQASVSANKQSGGRGGASTTSFNLYDPEIATLLKLKNPITPLAKQIRGLDYSFGSNRLLIQKAGRNEDIALFSYYGNEELYEAIYSGDADYFEKLYNEFVKSDKPRTMVSARKILVSALGEEFDTGRMYEHFPDSMNTHTPFLDKIYSSNLCLTGDTVLEVKSNGTEYKTTLKDVVNTQESLEVKSYNIDTKEVEYKLISAKALTAKNAKLMCITHNSGKYIECTPEHKVYTSNRGYVEAKDILSTDKLVIDGVQDNTDELLSIVNLANQEDVYDITVEDNHNFFANGILVHNCQEIFLPTAGFENVMELYSSYDEERNYILFQSDDSDYMYKIYNFAKVSTKRGDIYALKLQQGDTVTIPETNKVVKVHKVIKREQAGEIALCNIGGIIVSNIPDDETYSRVAKISLKLVHFGITRSDYVFKNLEETAKARMNAGIGIVGLAELMAKKGFKYSTQEGKNFIHEVAESHYWHLLNASLELSEEYGNADWMYKTKWVDGWTPLDTYCKEVDNLVTVDNKRDWVGISKRIKDNGGHAFSVLSSMMPSESCLYKDQRIRTHKVTVDIELEDGTVKRYNPDDKLTIIRNGIKMEEVVTNIVDGDDIIS